MLKKNLVRSSFLSPGLLFLLPVTVVNAEPSSITKEVSSITQLVSTIKYNDTLTAKADSLLSITTLAPKIQLNKHVSKFVKSFLQKEDEYLQKIKSKSGSSFNLIDGIFNKYGVPSELKYLAVVESDLKADAVSRVGAKGMWQLMPVTARELGLKVTGKYDERTQVRKSTTAAAKYLKSLYVEFGDWLLVLAAYNSGPGTVYKAIKKSGSRNFWALQNYLPEESRGHVKRFISIHYFFEGGGSIATQTKAEALTHQKTLEAYTISITEKQTLKDTITTVAMNTVVK
jgi:membrane-bound lytic murein transglycosylase D